MGVVQLKDGIVELRVVELSVCDETLARSYKLLSEDEAHRANRYRFPADRRKFVMARASLRQILARHLQTSPERVAFEYGEFGKPRLTMPNIDLRFNLSRSEEKAIIACALRREIGVDIECVHRGVEIDELAARFFTAAEQEKLRQFPENQKRQAFLRCWTCKEAFVKAVGKGLSLGLDEFDVSPGLGDPTAASFAPIEKFVVKGWSLIPFTSNDLDEYVSAIAVEGQDVGLTVQSWVNQKQ